MVRCRSGVARGWRSAKQASRREARHSGASVRACVGVQCALRVGCFVCTCCLIGVRRRRGRGAYVCDGSRERSACEAENLRVRAAFHFAGQTDSPKRHYTSKAGTDGEKKRFGLCECTFCVLKCPIACVRACQSWADRPIDREPLFVAFRAVCAHACSGNVCSGIAR